MHISVDEINLNAARSLPPPAQPLELLTWKVLLRQLWSENIELNKGVPFKNEIYLPYGLQEVFTVGKSIGTAQTEGMIAGAWIASTVTDVAETSDIETAIDASPTGVGSGAEVSTTASDYGKCGKAC